MDENSGVNMLLSFLYW